MEAIIEVLPVTASRVLRIWWSYFWRSLAVFAALFLVLILGSILFGMLLSVIMTLVGLDPASMHLLVRLVGAVFGFLVGLLSSVIPLWLILGRNFGEFRLALIAYRPAPAVAEGGDGV